MPVRVMDKDIAGRVVERIETLLRPVEAILRGEKPADFPPALHEQLSAMDADGFLLESLASYLTLPHEDPADDRLRLLKGVTSVNPIPAELGVRKDTLDAVTHAENIFNYKILGLDPYFRVTSEMDARDPVWMADDARALILTRGDVHSMRQGLHLLRAKFNGDVRMADTGLIIQNTHNAFWKPMLDELGISRLRPETLEALGIYITQYPGKTITSPQSTAEALRKLGPRMSMAPRPDRHGRNVSPGDAIYVVSGSQHKPIETASIFKTMLARVHVRSLNDSIEMKPREADEVSCSLEGNNVEKMMEARARLLEIGYDQACLQLCPRGKGPQNVWLVFDDRGLGFEERMITETEAFAPLRPLLNPYMGKPTPGAEMASIIKMVSQQRFFSELLAKAIAEIEARTGKRPSLDVTNKTCHFLVRLDDLFRDEPTFIATFGATRSVVQTRPTAGALPGAYFSENYTIPLSHNDRDAPNPRSKADIPDYIETASEMALSLGALGQVTGLRDHREHLSEFNISFQSAATREEKLRLATLHTLAPVRGHGVRHFFSGILNGSFKLMSGQHHRYDMYPHLSRVRATGRCNDRHRDAMNDALATLRRLYQDADGFIMTPDHPRLERMVPGLKWLKTLVFFSYTVGMQVQDRAISTKFFGHLAPEGDKTWSQQLDMFHYLNKTALLLNRFDQILVQRDNKKDLRKSLKDFRTRYSRPVAAAKPVIEKDGARKVPSDLFRVTIYCSATLSRETDACREALQFSQDIAERGFAVINGGGKDGLMVATSEGVHNARRAARAAKRRGARNHVTSYQCHDTYEREGGWHKDNDYACIFRNIEERMANLMNTDAEILFAGGAGSVQEIAASLLMRDWGLAPVRHRPLVIVNQMVDGQRAFTPLVNMMSADERKRLNVHVVNTGQEARAILEATRYNLSLDLGPDAIYLPEVTATASLENRLAIS